MIYPCSLGSLIVWQLGSKSKQPRERKPDENLMTLSDLALEVTWHHLCDIPLAHTVIEIHPGSGVD